MIPENQRAFKRVKKSFQVKFISYDDPSDATHSAVTKNISGGGLYCESVKPFKIGEKVSVEIFLSGKNKKVPCDGRVVRCEILDGHMVKTFGVAIEFSPASSSVQMKVLQNVLSGKK